jgi:hypothetical protein
MTLACLCFMAGCTLFQKPEVAQAQAQTQVADAMRAQQAETFAHGDAERDRFIAEHTEGYEPIGEPMAGKLESFATLPVQMKRGECYMMVFKLDSEARFSDHARTGIGFVYEKSNGETVNGGPGIHGAGGVGSGGCPLQDASATFDVQAYLGSATDRSRIHDLGEGGYSLQLMAKSITEEQLAELEADQARQIEESRRFAEEQDRQEAERAAAGCSRCREEHLECLALSGDKGACERERDSCAFRNAGLSSYGQCG